MNDEDRPMTPDEAADWLKLPALGFDTDTLRRWAKEGRIESIHIGGKLAFLREHLVRFVRHDSAPHRLKKVG